MRRTRSFEPYAVVALAPLLALFALGGASALAPLAGANEPSAPLPVEVRAGSRPASLPDLPALSPGDRLEVECAVSFGFRGTDQAEPLALQARIHMDVRERAEGIVVVGARVVVVSVRYRGPSLAFALEKSDAASALDTLEGTRGVSALRAAVPVDPAVLAMVERQRGVATAIGFLDGAEVEAVITPGKAPWVSLIDPLAASAGARAARFDRSAAMRDRLLRGLLLSAFPPVPLDLDPLAEGYDAGAARHRVVGSRAVEHPLRGIEVHIESREPTTFARAFYAYEAIHDVEGTPRALRLASRERARVHPALGLATFRQVDTVTAIELRDGRIVEAQSRWTTLLVGARVRSFERRTLSPLDP